MGNCCKGRRKGSEDEEDDNKRERRGGQNYNKGNKRRKQDDKTRLLDNQSIASSRPGSRRDAASFPLIDHHAQDSDQQSLTDEAKNIPRDSYKQIENENRSGDQSLTQEQIEVVKPSPSFPATRVKSQLRDEKSSDSDQRKRIKLEHDAAPRETDQHFRRDDVLRKPELLKKKTSDADKITQNKEAIYENGQLFQKNRDRSKKNTGETEIQHDAIYENAQQIQKDRDISPQIPEDYIKQKPESSKTLYLETESQHDDAFYENAQQIQKNRNISPLIPADYVKQKPKSSKTLYLETETQHDDAIYENAQQIQKNTDIIPQIPEETEIQHDAIYENAQQIQKNRDISPQIVADYIKQKPESSKTSYIETVTQHDDAIYENAQQIQKDRDISPQIPEETVTQHDDAIYENAQQILKNRDIGEDSIEQKPESWKTLYLESETQQEDAIYENTQQIQKNRDISPKIPEEASKSNCLKEFLKSIGLEAEKYCKSLSDDGIFTLEELQQTINDEEKAAKFDNKIKGIDNDCLNAAVKHEDILKQLEIIGYFPEGITLQKVMSKASGKLDRLSDVPWYFLSKMLMIDYRCRDDLLPKPESEESTESEEAVDDIFAQFTEEHNQCLGPHPIDILIAIFQCSSNMLTQVLCEKIFVCKLALPLLLPPFISRYNKLFLWSLRNINIGYKTSNGEFHDNSLINCPTSVVSCIRLGKPSISKSKFLNEILNGQTHNTFFHKDCSNGMLDRKVSEGLLEFAVYIPSNNKGNSRNQLSEVVTLVNLRGDGLEHAVSRNFLMKMSNIIIVMVNISDLDQVLISSLKSLTSSENDLILILTKNSSTKFDIECKNLIRNCVKEIENERFKGSNLILGFTAGSGEKNMKELLDEVLSKISKFLEKKTEKSTIVELKDLATSLNMNVDEKTTECSSSHSASQHLLENVKRINIENARGELLPLQCQLWQEWARINKNEQRLLNKGTGTEGCDHKKRDIRREQRGRFEQPKCFIRSFIDLMNKEANNRQYILKWLKLCLDDISRKKIPVLQEEYGKKWEEICQTYDDARVESLRNELNALEVRIADASFGIEHLFREIGQVYEAYKESECEETEADQLEINRLPHLMAQLLLQGYPLEIMDGDASHVPLTWVKAVLKELANVIGADKKLFALSVLGAQSSGKSTLLNTMFGLQFPVAAGRCTRGVYAQLVPMCKDQNTNYDYILVLDTEGLKAPELGKVKFNHDNEIATLVTGLGDVTLVNVKGENVSDMQDVLQIVVHAMLKMRLVNKSLKMQPTCIFLHQNVSVPDAAQKMKKGQQNFMEILNKVTRVTGEMENASHIYKLHQVIEFDIDKHIWYFSDLWEGDPPMAPANPGYSDKVQKLKRSLLTDIMQQRTNPLTISELCLRIDDLWNGILHEDFVFSLKNNLESRAYIALETKLLDITKDLKKRSSEWISKKTNTINYSRVTTQNPLEKRIGDCEKDLVEVFRNGKRKLEAYFDMSEDNEMIDQWRNNIMSKLHNTYQEILTETKRKLVPLETAL